jgi:2-hydroxychromene-2-carboxylate isomerase
MEFWFTLGSTYTYLSVMRVSELSRAAGVDVVWRPFQLRTILEELAGMPFAEGSPKTRYMWTDLARQAQARGLAPHLPAPYPNMQAHLGNRVMRLAVDEGWGEEFARAWYRRWFETDAGPMARDDVLRCIEEAGGDGARAVEMAETQDMIDKLDRETDRARELGLFGAPSFVVGEELFWGDDRLEQALARCKDRQDGAT